MGRLARTHRDDRLGRLTLEVERLRQQLADRDRLIGTLADKAYPPDPDVELVHQGLAIAPEWDEALQQLAETFVRVRLPGVEALVLLYDGERVVGSSSDDDRARAVDAADTFVALERAAADTPIVAH